MVGRPGNEAKCAHLHSTLALSPNPADFQRDPDTLLQVKTFSESFLRHVTDAGNLATGLTTTLTFIQIETTPNNNFSIDIIVVWLTWPH